jgi:hypothetical protein
MKARTLTLFAAINLFAAMAITVRTSAQGPIFAPAVVYAPGGYGSGGLGSFAVGDVNGDGKPDLVVANQCGNDSSCVTTSNGTVGVLLGNGDGNFQTAVTYSSGASTGTYKVNVMVTGDSFVYAANFEVK